MSFDLKKKNSFLFKSKYVGLSGDYLWAHFRKLYKIKQRIQI
jgi:hypothetical protein